MREESKSLQAAEQLLRVGSVVEVARFIIERSLLADGRFEAHEFGRRQHSSASAGGLLIGLSGIHALPDDLIGPVVDKVAEIILLDGRVRGHDSDRKAGDTTWSESQILWGLSIRPRLVTVHLPRVLALTARLISMQDSGGGWPLRQGEHPQVTFAFYPALALTQVYGAAISKDTSVRDSLTATARHLLTLLDDAGLTLEERILAIFAYERIQSTVHNLTLPPVDEHRRDVLSACWQPDSGLHLSDHTIVIYTQPVWHSITWRPLLYLCARKWLSPLNPVTTLLGAELVKTFNRALSAWPGPVGAVSRGTGSSWASALALRATVALGADLAAAGVSAEEFAHRAEQLSTDKYVYDVAISFAGADRKIALLIAERIKKAGLRVFYDHDHQHALLGEDLAAFLQRTYATESRFVVVLISAAFLASRWAGNWEWRAVLARMQRQQTGYLLPYVLEEIELPGLNPTLGYVSAVDFSPESFAELVIRKVRSQS